jgi:hypothetical protein
MKHVANEENYTINVLIFTLVLLLWHLNPKSYDGLNTHLTWIKQEACIKFDKETSSE